MAINIDIMSITHRIDRSKRAYKMNIFSLSAHTIVWNIFCTKNPVVWWLLLFSQWVKGQICSWGLNIKFHWLLWIKFCQIASFSEVYQNAVVSFKSILRPITHWPPSGHPTLCHASVTVGVWPVVVNWTHGTFSIVHPLMWSKLINCCF